MCISHMEKHSGMGYDSTVHKCEYNATFVTANQAGLSRKDSFEDIYRQEENIMKKFKTVFMRGGTSKGCLFKKRIFRRTGRSGMTSSCR